MFTMAIGLNGQARSEGWTPTRALRFAALIGALLLASLAVNALAILAHGSLRAEPAAAGDAQLVADKATACGDSLALRRSVSHPFRGANAPLYGQSL